MNRRNFITTLAASSVATMLASRISFAATPPSDVRITRVRILNPPGFKTLAGPVGLAETVVVVETNAGVTGYGQGGTPDLLRYAASLLIGQDPTRIEYHWQRMYRSSIYPAGRERLHAVGALDCALWDIKGKLLGVPVYELLGGRVRDYVECYRSFGALRLEDARETASKTMALSGAANGASSEFVSTYKRFSKAVEAGNKEEADAQRAKLKAQNLYEEAYQHFGTYFYHRSWGTPAEQLTDLRLAIAGEKHPEYLPKVAFTAALGALFSLETKAGDFGSALETWEILEPILPPASRPDFQSAVDQIHALQTDSRAVSMSATIEKGNYWSGTLFRKRFSINVKSGAVSEIKLRCQKQYLFFRYQPNLQYSIGAKKDHCGIEVVGDPGTVFELIQ